VVFNARFEPDRDRYPRIAKRRLPLMIARGRVEFYEPELESEKNR